MSDPEDPLRAAAMHPAYKPAETGATILDSEIWPDDTADEVFFHRALEAFVNAHYAGHSADSPSEEADAAVVQEFKFGLQRGAISTIGILRDGVTLPIPPYRWKAPKALEEVLVSGVMTFTTARSSHRGENGLVFVLRSSLEDAAAVDLLGPAATARGRRGPRATKGPAVQEAMRRVPADELAEMTEEAMAAQFDASRDTCRKARNAVLRSVDNSRHSPTIDK